MADKQHSSVTDAKRVLHFLQRSSASRRRSSPSPYRPGDQWLRADTKVRAVVAQAGGRRKACIPKKAAASFVSKPANKTLKKL